LLLILAMLQVKLWVSGGMREVWRLQDAVVSQQADNAKQKSRNEQLAAEVADLKEGAEAVEERARAELGMVKTDEVFYQVVESNLTTLPGVASFSDQPGTDVQSPVTQQLAGAASTMPFSPREH
jgi:cell division protein FtsB